MYNREFTPERITELKSNEIFVFGSNPVGYKIRYKENGKVIIVVIMGGKIFLPIIIL